MAVYYLCYPRLERRCREGCDLAVSPPKPKMCPRLIDSRLTARVKTRNRILSRGFYKLALAGCFAINILVTVLLTQASVANYPGGEALREFNVIVAGSEGMSGAFFHYGKKLRLCARNG